MSPGELIDILEPVNVPDIVNMAASSQAFLVAVVEDNRASWKVGERPDGKKIGKYRNKYYAKKKNVMNPDAGMGNVDLMYTHETERSMFAQSDSGEIEISSLSEVTPSLMSRYGDDIFGLREKQAKSPEILNDEIVIEYKKKTGL